MALNIDPLTTSSGIARFTTATETARTTPTAANTTTSQVVKPLTTTFTPIWSNSCQQINIYTNLSASAFITSGVYYKSVPVEYTTLYYWGWDGSWEFNTELGVDVPYLSTMCYPLDYSSLFNPSVASYYSPGLCPSAFSSCGQGDGVIFSGLQAGESAAVCCPNSYTCGSANRCYSVIPSNTNARAVAGTHAGLSANPYDFLAQTVSGGLTVTALGIETRWKKDDFKQPTTSRTIILAVVIPVVVIALLIGLVWWYLRRRKGRKGNQADVPMPVGEEIVPPHEMEAKPVGHQTTARELDGARTPQELESSQPTELGGRETAELQSRESENALFGRRVRGDHVGSEAAELPSENVHGQSPSDGLANANGAAAGLVTISGIQMAGGIQGTTERVTHSPVLGDKSDSSAYMNGSEFPPPPAVSSETTDANSNRRRQSLSPTGAAMPTIVSGSMQLGSGLIPVDPKSVERSLLQRELDAIQEEREKLTLGRLARRETELQEQLRNI